MSPLSRTLLLLAAGSLTCAGGRRSSAASQAGDLARDVDETARPKVELSEFPGLLKAVAEKGSPGPRCRNVLKKLGRLQDKGVVSMEAGAAKEIAREAVGCLSQMRHEKGYQLQLVARDMCLLTGVLGTKEPLDAILETDLAGAGSVLFGAIHFCECSSMYRNATAKQLTRLMDKAAEKSSPPQVVRLLVNMMKFADKGVLQAMVGKVIGYVSDNTAEVQSGSGSLLLTRILARLGESLPAAQAQQVFKELGRRLLAESNATRLDTKMMRVDMTLRGWDGSTFEAAQRREIAQHILELSSKNYPIGRLNRLNNVVGFEAMLSEAAERPKALRLLPSCNRVSVENLEAWAGTAKGVLSQEALQNSLRRWSTPRRCRGFRAARELGESFVAAAAEHSKDADFPSRIAKLAAACSAKGEA